MAQLPRQTNTPYNVLVLPQKTVLVKEFVGEPLSALRTPAFVIDRAIFAKNCAQMHESAKQWGATFRAHLKTHKTVEGTKLQLNSAAGQTHAVVVSTMIEAWEVVKAGLIADGTVTDILYSMPVAANKIGDLEMLREAMGKYGGSIRLMVDHIQQVTFLEEFNKQWPKAGRWSVFVKIDAGSHRAGVTLSSPNFDPLLTRLLTSPAISVFGFYSHAGHAYASNSLLQATSFLSAEVEAVNTAAGFALAILEGSAHENVHNKPFVLSVGSTPTAHAASAESRAQLATILNGTLELHAGNYPLLDLQQLYTGLIRQEQISQRVLATVVSYYPGRGDGGTDEAMCDAGALAFSKDTGRISGHGDVVGKPWRLSKISQEHGTLTQIAGGAEDKLEIGSVISIIGQHACLIAAGFPWYYIVDSDLPGRSEEVVDIWVPWKGW